MKNNLIKIILAFANITFLGIGEAIADRPQKGIFLQLGAAGCFAFGGYCGIFSSFTGMLLIYTLIATIYLSFFSFLNKETLYFQKWYKKLFIYIGAVFFIKLVLIVPVRIYFFEPYKYENSFIMTDKRGNAEPQPLYIFWNQDFSLIGKSLVTPKNT